MNHTIETILKRRSIRKYTNQEISQETIELLLQAGMNAPSAVAKDPWHFLVLKNNQTIKDLLPAMPNGKMLEHAQAAIIVLGDLSLAHDNQLSYLLQDCSAAIENILLAATSLGIGSCWVGIHPREARGQFVKEKFDLPDNIIPVSVISLGYPAEKIPTRNRYNQAKVHWEKY